MKRYRLKLSSDSYVGGMMFKGRYGRTKAPAMAVVFAERKEADAAAIMYGAWVEEYESEPMPNPFPAKGT